MITWRGFPLASGPSPHHCNATAHLWSGDTALLLVGLRVTELAPVLGPRAPVAVAETEGIDEVDAVLQLVSVNLRAKGELARGGCEGGVSAVTMHHGEKEALGKSGEPNTSDADHHHRGVASPLIRPPLISTHTRSFRTTSLSSKPSRRRRGPNKDNHSKE